MPIPTADVTKIYQNDPGLKKSDVEALLDWASKQPHLPRISELQTILFLQSCYYSSEMAKSSIDNFFTIRALCPEFFANRDPMHPSVRSALSCVVLCPLPILTPPPNNHTVIFIKLRDTNPANYNLAGEMKQFDMTEMLQLHQHGPQHGLELVIDMQGTVFGHLAKMNIMVMKKFLYYLQEAMPLRLKGIHHINVVPVMDKILAMMKPFMKKELFEMVHIHTSIESLYKFVPKECLPAEYGGKSEALDVLREKLEKEFNDNAEYFHYEESQVVDESKRPGKPKNACDFFGVEGTFKKLEVD